MASARQNKPTSPQAPFWWDSIPGGKRPESSGLSQPRTCKRPRLLPWRGMKSLNDEQRKRLAVKGGVGRRQASAEGPRPSVLALSAFTTRLVIPHNFIDLHVLQVSGQGDQIAF